MSVVKVWPNSVLLFVKDSSNHYKFVTVSRKEMDESVEKCKPTLDSFLSRSYEGNEDCEIPNLVEDFEDIPELLPLREESPDEAEINEPITRPDTPRPFVYARRGRSETFCSKLQYQRKIERKGNFRESYKK